MNHQPGSSHFQQLFDVALQHYENTTDIVLIKHPLAEQLQKCHSVESTTSLLHEKARELGDFRGSDRILTSIRSTVSILSTISANATLGEAMHWHLVGPKIPEQVFHLMRILQSFTPARAVYTGLAILLVVCVMCICYVCIHLTSRFNQATKGMNTNYNALLEMLEAVERLLKPLNIYIELEIPYTPTIDEMVARIMTELLFTLALATKELKQGRSSESVLANVLR
jgi:hypothetical protein